MQTALFPGTFDPPSFGHLDIIKRASSLCNKLYIGIAAHSSKPTHSLFSLEERIEMVKEITKDIPHLEIVSFSGLVVDFARKNQIQVLIRGMRAFSDFEYEFRMALANRKLSGIETLFLMADGKHAHISSSLIREIGQFSRLHEFVPSVIEEKVFAKISKK
jgi:pantetheine-phosphate adenylyltransferase